MVEVLTGQEGIAPPGKNTRKGPRTFHVPERTGDQWKTASAESRFGWSVVFVVVQLRLEEQK
jgi:hypothetical protein